MSFSNNFDQHCFTFPSGRSLKKIVGKGGEGTKVRIKVIK
jgi:hypothetical protein